MTLGLWGAWAQGRNLPSAPGLRNPEAKRPKKVGWLAFPLLKGLKVNNFLHPAESFPSVGLEVCIPDDIQTVLTSGLHEKPFS